MRTLLRLMAVSTGTLVSVTGITNCQSTCEERGDCNTFTGTGGASGTGGKGGTGGDLGGTGATAGTGTGGTAGTEGGAGAGGEGGAGAVGGTGGTGGEGGMGPDPCDPERPVAGCVINDPDGIYVAPSGNDGDDGSKGSPVQTISKAIEQAADTSRTIYVCNSTYGEQLEISDSGLVIRAGYTCPGATTGWIYDATMRARVRPADPGYALRVSDVTSLTISDMEFVARDAEAPGESSVTVFVTFSEGVSFARTRITAGDGMEGADGVLTGSNLLTTSLDGDAAVGATGGGAKQCNCPDGGKSVGAIGGAGGVTPTDGGKGLPSYDMTGGSAGKGGLSCMNGGNGSPAPARSDAARAQQVGAIDALNGWVPGSGGSGLNGQPGQGGGGGGGGDSLPGKGGGGGGSCGGCGGLGAPGGKGGGASVGILATDSVITLDALSRIDTGNAGSGGAGQAGETGQGGGTRGAADGNGCLGGVGGKGATGGASAGGNGGISAGILWQGSTITAMTGVTFNIGNEGTPGQGGGAANDGLPGVAQDIFEL